MLKWQEMQWTKIHVSIFFHFCVITCDNGTNLYELLGGEMLNKANIATHKDKTYTAAISRDFSPYDVNYVNDWGFTPCGERVLAADITCQNHRVSVEIIVMTKNMHTLTVIDGNGNKIYDGNPIPMEIQHTTG